MKNGLQEPTLSSTQAGRKCLDAMYEGLLIASQRCWSCQASTATQPFLYQRLHC